MDCASYHDKEAIDIGRWQYFQDFRLPPPCPHLGLIQGTKFPKPPLLCLLLDLPPSPLCVDVLYVWSLIVIKTLRNQGSGFSPRNPSRHVEATAAGKIDFQIKIT